MRVTTVDQPDWLIKLESETPDVEHPFYPKATLEEFCGRFDLTTGKALSEIRRCKLWDCGKSLHFFKKDATDNPYLIPLPEFDRYAAIIEEENEVNQPPLTHPCLDPIDDFYSEELALAIRAWEYARSNRPTKSNFMVRIDAFLDKHGVGENQRDRIKTICSRHKRGPKPGNKK